MDLVVLDMHGVLTDKRLAYVLIEKCRRNGLVFWRQFREGKLSVQDVVRMVGATHKGLAHGLMEMEASKIPPAEHARDLIEGLGDDCGILMGTADYGNLARKIASEVGVGSYFANEAVYDDRSVHTGKIAMPIVDGDGKANRAKAFKEANGFKRIIAIGDDISDLDLFMESDVSIAYNSKNDALRSIATYEIDGGNLLDVLDMIYKRA